MAADDIGGPSDLASPALTVAPRVNHRRLVIIGGGITGLAAAWEASATPGVAVTVLDDGGGYSTHGRDSRSGGKLRSSTLAGVATDEGADMFLARVPEGLALADELGLADRITAPVAGGAAIWLNGAAHPMPGGLVLGVPTDPDALKGSALLEAADAAAVRSELLRAGDAVTEDRSVGSLIRERLGDRIADRLVQPLLGGINAGVLDRLSLAAVAPQLDRAARSGPSLTAALVDERQAAAAAAAQAAALELPPVQPAFYGLPGGMAELISTLRTQLTARGVQLRDGVRATSVTQHGGELRVGLTSSPDGRAGSGTGGAGSAANADVTTGTLDADAVILALPAAASAALLQGAAPQSAAALSRFRTASVAMLRLAVRPERVETPPGRSGLLVPHNSGFTTVAVSYSSTKWAHLAEDGLVRLRISVGHDADPESPRLPEQTLVERLLAEAHSLTGLDGPIEDWSLIRWPDAFPQYDVGHLDRCQELDDTLATELPNVLVTGASFRGIGIPGCIRQGREAATSVVG